MAQSISGWPADEQAAYAASHMDQFDIAAKKGDIEREQTEYEDLPQEVLAPYRCGAGPAFTRVP